MKNRNLLKAIILFLIILFFFTLVFMIYLIKISSNNSQVASIKNEEPESAKEVIEISKSEFLKEEDNKIYLKFSENLYDDNGNSNESYFNKLIDELKPLYKNRSFNLIDETKNINIYIKYLENDNKYTIIINGTENYFKQVNGKNYADVRNVSIADKTVMYTKNEILIGLVARDMSPGLLRDVLIDEKVLENGYISYNDDKFRFRTTLIKTVRNIIFTEKYDDDIIVNVNMKTPLKQILELYPDNVFGSLNENYLGYLTKDYYYFFYDDEVSVYGYTYDDETKFEKYLTEYLESKDLDQFVNSLQKGLKYYDYCEYDPEIGKAHIMYSNRGFEINIEENNPKGIVLYSNYHFTDTTREYLEKGLITLKANEDSVEKIEKERRNNR